MRHLLVALSASCALALGCGSPHSPLGRAEPLASPDPGSEIVRLVPRTKLLESYPCAECHDAIKELTGRRPATHRQIRLEHMPEGICATCHRQEDMNQLHLLNGKTTSFDEPAALCAQCHFREEKDWSLGVHGKQVGMWQGSVRHRYQCVSCHDAHAPHFGEMRPAPPPPRPELGVRKVHLEGHATQGAHDAQEGARP